MSAENFIPFRGGLRSLLFYWADDRWEVAGDSPDNRTAREGKSGACHLSDRMERPGCIVYHNHTACSLTLKYFIEFRFFARRTNLPHVE